jgi:CheY-like chemotaxis protein
MVEAQPPAGFAIDAPAAAPCTLNFAVQDSGIGIACESIPALFEPFAQADTTRTRKYGGTGLGLAICRRLVELMHGTIGVTSEPGAGSTFAFTVQVGTGAPAQTLPGFGPNRRALVVGKENRSRACLVAQLQGMGLAATALDTLPAGAGKADVLLLDANVFGSQPDAVGEAWAAQLNSLWPHRILIVGAVSGVGDYARQHGFEHYLPKPIKRKTLHKALAEALFGQMAGGNLSLTASNGLPGAANGHNGYHTHYDAANSQTGAAEAPLQILLAEDNLDNQRIIERMVKKLGHKVDLVVNGRQATEAARSKCYDVVLMDLHMPEMDGLEATRLIRQMPQHRNPRIVALTADAMLETQQSCRAVGMDDCLCKPLKFEQLNRMLRKMAVGQ